MELFISVVEVTQTMYLNLSKHWDSQIWPSNVLGLFFLFVCFFHIIEIVTARYFARLPVHTEKRISAHLLKSRQYFWLSLNPKFNASFCNEVSAKECDNGSLWIASYLATCECQVSAFTCRRNSCHCKTPQSWNTNARSGSATSQVSHWTLKAFKGCKSSSLFYKCSSLFSTVEIKEI